MINWGFSHHWFAFENLVNFHLKFVTFARKTYKKNRFASFKSEKIKLFLFVQLHNCCWCSSDYISLQLCIVCWSAPASRYFKHLISTSFISTVFFRCIFEKRNFFIIFYFCKSMKGCLCSDMNLNYFFNFSEFSFKVFFVTFLRKFFLHWLKIHFFDKILSS